MGQQQLLLLVLGAIIVGLAIVVGINLFGQGAVKANEDAVRQDILSMMARAEEYYRKPITLGGAGKTADSLATISWAKLGYRFNSDGSAITDSCINDNGSYKLEEKNGNVVITGTLAENRKVEVKGTLKIDKNQVTSIEIKSN